LRCFERGLRQLKSSARFLTWTLVHEAKDGRGCPLFSLPSPLASSQVASVRAFSFSFLHIGKCKAGFLALFFGFKPAASLTLCPQFALARVPPAFNLLATIAPFCRGHVNRAPDLQILALFCESLDKCDLPLDAPTRRAPSWGAFVCMY